MRLVLSLAVAALFGLAAAASANPPAKGWITKGPKENRERVHRVTGLACSTELLPGMNLMAFGAAKTIAPGRPFCEYERTGDVVRVYILGRSSLDPLAVKAMTAAAREGDLAKRGFPVFQAIDVISSDAKTPWTGVAFDLTKGQSKTPGVASISFARINGWDVRLDIDYKITAWNDPGPSSQEAELRDAMSYLLTATLKKPK